MTYAFNTPALLADYQAMEKWDRSISRDRTFRADVRRFAKERADRYAATAEEIKTALGA